MAIIQPTSEEVSKEKGAGRGDTYIRGYRDSGTVIGTPTADILAILRGALDYPIV